MQAINSHKEDLNFSNGHIWNETSVIDFNNILLNPVYPNYYHLNM